MTKRLVALTLFLTIFIGGIIAQKYVVISVTGKVILENAGAQKRELKLREALNPQSILNVPYKGQVELLDEADGKKYTIKVPGKGALGNMIKDRQNTVMQLTAQYLSYIKARVKSDGELSSRRYSDPATVTREVCIKKNTFEEDFDIFRQQSQSKYQKFRQDAIRKYAEFVRSAWKEFGPLPPRPKPVKEKEVPPVVIEEQLLLKPISSTPIKIDSQPIVLPDVKPQPVPIAPILEQPIMIEEEQEMVNIPKGGKNLQGKLNGKEEKLDANVPQGDIISQEELRKRMQEEQEMVDIPDGEGQQVKINGKNEKLQADGPLGDIISQEELIKQKKKLDQELMAQYVDFDLYGTSFHARFTEKEAFQIKNLTPDGIADVYEQMASANFNNTIRDCLELRIRHQLNDWAYLNMLQSLANSCFPTQNEATMFMAWIAQQTGYKVRLAIRDDRLYMLYATEHMIYGRGYYTIDGEDFYVFGEDVGRLKICNAEYPNEQPISLRITQPMLIDETRTDARTLQSKRYSDMCFKTDVNKNLLNFYEAYPTSSINGNLMTRWAMYANVPLDASISHTLVAELHEKLKGLKETEAMERLLNWVQTAFVYEYDDKVWGGDRAFFPEETLYYPYCDCEDRSILLSRLVRDLLGLKVVLVYYPGHLAMAVCFNSDVPGDYIEYEGNRYVVCDPTYIGARIGMTMPGMNNKEAKVILL